MASLLALEPNTEEPGLGLGLGALGAGSWVLVRGCQGQGRGKGGRRGGLREACALAWTLCRRPGAVPSSPWCLAHGLQLYSAPTRWWWWCGSAVGQGCRGIST